jgi:hypothetical protein
VADGSGSSKGAETAQASRITSSAHFQFPRAFPHTLRRGMINPKGTILSVALHQDRSSGCDCATTNTSMSLRSLCIGRCHDQRDCVINTRLVKMNFSISAPGDDVRGKPSQNPRFGSTNGNGNIPTCTSILNQHPARVIR